MQRTIHYRTWAILIHRAALILIPGTRASPPNLGPLKARPLMTSTDDECGRDISTNSVWVSVGLLHEIVTAERNITESWLFVGQITKSEGINMAAKRSKVNVKVTRPNTQCSDQPRCEVAHHHRHHHRTLYWKLSPQLNTALTYTQHWNAEKKLSNCKKTMHKQVPSSSMK